MSFKIFTLQFLGKIKPVEKIESGRKTLISDYNEFLQVDTSDELKLFLSLEKEINSEEFKKRKEEIQSLQFKDSKEYNLLKEYESLKKMKSIRNYFKAIKSPELTKYESFRNSDKLKEYDNLTEYIKEGQFQKDKEEVNSNIYKGSVEEQHLNDLRKLEKSSGINAWLKINNSPQLERHEKEGSSEKIKKYLDLKNTPHKDKQQKKDFNLLKKDPGIKNYFKFEQSKVLKLYKETAGSHDLARFLELKDFVNNEPFKKRVEYLKDGKKFEKTEAFNKWKRYKELNNDADIRFFMKYEKSSIYKNYLDVNDSFNLTRYFELEELINSKEFREQKAYLEDRHKWEKTEDHAKELKFRELKNKPHLIKYFKYKGTNAFDFLKEWEVSFNEDFASPSINSDYWSVMPSWAEKTLGKNYAMPGDLHLFTQGQNVKTGGKLIIETRKENTGGLVWKMPAGFVPQEFGYTSGLISSAKSFKQNDGIVEAKIKFNPVKEVVSSCVLMGENVSPRVYLLEMGTKNRLGIAETAGNGKQKLDGFDISNLHKNKWYIFSLQKAGRNFTWKINDTEVFMMEYTGIDFPMHINFMTLVLDHIKSSGLPIQFQVEWIKCYKRKE